MKTIIGKWVFIVGFLLGIGAGAGVLSTTFYFKTQEKTSCLKSQQVFTQYRNFNVGHNSVPYADLALYIPAATCRSLILQTDKTCASAYYNVCDTCRGKGDFDGAIAACTKVIKLDPNYANAYGIRGLAHYDKGEYETAVEDMEKAIKINPSLYNQWLGGALEKARNYLK